MIEEIDKLIEKLRIGYSEEEYGDLVYNVNQFRIEVGKKEESLIKNDAWIGSEISKYIMKYKGTDDNFKSDLACKSMFRQENTDKIFKIEVLRGEVEMLKKRLKAYDEMAKLFNQQNINMMHRAKFNT